MLCRFPDLYDYGRRDGDTVKSRGIGRYCLMGSGNHLDLGCTPAPISADLRDLIGWPDRTVSLAEPGEHEARHGDYDTVLKYPASRSTEYFLVENRSRMGLDAFVPSEGLCVYHCDREGSNEWQDGTPSRHYQCAVLQADGRMDLEHNRPADATDLYGRTEGVALSHDSLPHSRQWDGSDSGLTIADISAPGEVISFRTGETTAKTVVRATATADLLIPDADAEGIASAIVIERRGASQRFKVGVQIVHTWRGDLEVELQAPSGERLVLHDREGRDKDDLTVTYASDGDEATVLAALASLHGQQMAGAWTLRVRDRASAGTGRLQAWSLEIAYAAADRVAEGASAPALEIPDDDARGVRDQIELAGDGTAQAIEVAVEIAHSFVRDLQVELVAPSGGRAVLHDRGGGSGDDIRTTFIAADTPGLQTLVGGPVQGTWALEVRDLERSDRGRLERWALKVSY